MGANTKYAVQFNEFSGICVNTAGDFIWALGDGSEIWRVLLSPYSEDSYSMVQPTVVDGRIYTGNDFGAVYCLSDIEGEGTEEERVQALETVGFAHWSWYLAAVIIALSMISFAILYRRTMNV